MRTVHASKLFQVFTTKLPILSLAFGALLLPLQSHAKTGDDECAAYLSYSQERRIAAALALVTNARDTEKVSVAILLEKACLGQLPGFSRQEANHDVKPFLPYLENESRS